MSFHRGYTARSHRQQVATRGTDNETDDRATPADLFDNINARHGPFTVDVAASGDNTKCERFYTRATDGLAHSWDGELVWCNPPYSAIEPWIRKGWSETHHGTCRGVVYLLPANRTEQAWWQDLIEPYRDRGPEPTITTEFVRGRLRFLRPGAVAAGPNERPPFGVVIVRINPGPVDAMPDVATLFHP